MDKMDLSDKKVNMNSRETFEKYYETFYEKKHDNKKHTTIMG